MSNFSAKQKDSLSSGSFPLDANVLCTLNEYKWGQISTKKGMMDAFILIFKTLDGQSLIENIYDVTFENVYVFQDETREAAFKRKSKEINFIINNLLYAYGLQDIAENLSADSCREFCELCIDALKPVHPEDKLVYIKTINNKEGYSEIPKRGNTPFIQLALKDGDELLPGTLAYTKYEQDLILKNKASKSKTSEEKTKPGQIVSQAVIDDDDDNYTDYNVPAKIKTSDELLNGFNQE